MSEEQEFVFVLEQNGTEERRTIKLPTDELLSYVPDTAVCLGWPEFSPWAPAQLRLLRPDGTDHFVWKLHSHWVLVDR